jgi:hypothetical protein
VFHAFQTLKHNSIRPYVYTHDRGIVSCFDPLLIGLLPPPYNVQMSSTCNTSSCAVTHSTEYSGTRTPMYASVLIKDDCVMWNVSLNQSQNEISGSNKRKTGKCTKLCAVLCHMTMFMQSIGSRVGRHVSIAAGMLPKVHKQPW